MVYRNVPAAFRVVEDDEIEGCVPAVQNKRSPFRCRIEGVGFAARSRVYEGIGRHYYFRSVDQKFVLLVADGGFKYYKLRVLVKAKGDVPVPCMAVQHHVPVPVAELEHEGIGGPGHLVGSRRHVVVVDVMLTFLGDLDLRIVNTRPMEHNLPVVGLKPLDCIVYARKPRHGAGKVRQ